ncbi:MAG: hypothetical protein ACE5FL_14740 [Myxococcota bacterium]
MNNRFRLLRLRSQNIPAYEASDVILEEHLDYYRERLLEIDLSTFDLKWELLWESVDRLLARGCDLYLVEAPVSAMFREERRGGDLGDFSERLARAAAERGIPMLLDVELPTTPNLMWDHTHVNERGRDRFTGMLIDRWAERWRGTAGD